MYVDIRKLNQMHLNELEYLYASVKKPNWSAFPFPDAVPYVQEIEKVS